MKLFTNGNKPIQATRPYISFLDLLG